VCRSFFVLLLRAKTSAWLTECVDGRSAGSNDYINNFLQPFMADGTTYTHGQFVRLLITTMDRQLKARTKH
jgi:hypothetical protein